MGFAGRFEGHLTVDTQDKSHFLRVVDVLGLKPVMLQLEGASDNPHTTHLMTASWHDGALEDVLTDLKIQAQTMGDQGLQVVRTKVECTLASKGVPKQDREATRQIGCYFEQHFKVRFEENEPNEGLRKVCKTHGAEMARILTPHGHEIGLRYITIRHHRRGMSTVSVLTKQFLADLRRINLKPMKIHSEYNVHDSNPDLDRGWA